MVRRRVSIRRARRRILGGDFAQSDRAHPQQLFGLRAELLLDLRPRILGMHRLLDHRVQRSPPPR